MSRRTLTIRCPYERCKGTATYTETDKEEGTFVRLTCDSCERTFKYTVHPPTGAPRAAKQRRLKRVRFKRRIWRKPASATDTGKEHVKV